MDETEKLKDQAPQEEHYEPRPAWQVWAARVGLVFAILFVVYQVLSIATGGL